MADLFPVPDSPAVTVMARDFLQIEAAIFLFFCLDAVATGILRAAGRTLVPLVVTLGANALNIFLNWVFIYGNLGAPAMGVRGASFAPLTVTKAAKGTLSGSIDLAPEQVRALKAGQLYIQISSEKAPDGNLWGWFVR